MALHCSQKNPFSSTSKPALLILSMTAAAAFLSLSAVFWPDHPTSIIRCHGPSFCRTLTSTLHLVNTCSANQPCLPMRTPTAVPRRLARGLAGR